MVCFNARATQFVFLLATNTVLGEFDVIAEQTANAQLMLDTKALQIAYATDFDQKVNPGKYPTRASMHILEMLNSAEFLVSNAKHVTNFMLAAYLCFTEPDTDGCGHFNDLGCEVVGADCDGFATSSEQSLASLCTRLDKGRKMVTDGCFIVSLAQNADGSGQEIAPWNEDVEDWFTSHNCTSLMYHLKYRCFSTLIKWNDITAQTEYVDLGKLFDITFGITAVANFNGKEALECSSLTGDDREMLTDIAKLHVEAAVLTFISTATNLARFGLAAIDVVNVKVGSHMQDKLRTTMLLNLFYDGAVQPFRELCCVENMCYDYHPMDVLADKVSAFNTFYPGGMLSLSDEAAQFAGTPGIGKMLSATGVPVTVSDAHVYNVIRTSAQRAAWQGAVGMDLTNIEKF